MDGLGGLLQRKRTTLNSQLHSRVQQTLRKAGGQISEECLASILVDGMR